MQPEDEPGARDTRVDGPISNLRRSKLISPMHEDGSDNKADSPCFQTKTQHDQIRRRTEEFPDIRILDELVQRQIEEAKLQLRSGSKQDTAKVSISLSPKQF